MGPAPGGMDDCANDDGCDMDDFAPAEADLFAPYKPSSRNVYIKHQNCSKIVLFFLLFAHTDFCVLTWHARLWRIFLLYGGANVGRRLERCADDGVLPFGIGTAVVCIGLG